ncbi:hypothetical protein BG842_13035 [Haladaptatus sp. W1]|nr:hypothetical protein BG842_13035 [Haladaptatus sp. W1]
MDSSFRPSKCRRVRRRRERCGRTHVAAVGTHRTQSFPRCKIDSKAEVIPKRSCVVHNQPGGRVRRTNERFGGGLPSGLSDRSAKRRPSSGGYGSHALLHILVHVRCRSSHQRTRGGETPDQQ